MANELQSSINFRVAKGSLDENIVHTHRADLASENLSEGVQVIGTTEEAIDINADVVAPRHAVFINLDITNYVQIGIYASAVFYPFSRLRPGEHARLPLDPSSTYYAKANTAAVKLRFFVLDT